MPGTHHHQAPMNERDPCLANNKAADTAATTSSNISSTTTNNETANSNGRDELLEKNTAPTAFNEEQPRDNSVAIMSPMQQKNLALLLSVFGPAECQQMQAGYYHLSATERNELEDAASDAVIQWLRLKKFAHKDKLDVVYWSNLTTKIQNWVQFYDGVTDNRRAVLRLAGYLLYTDCFFHSLIRTEEEKRQLKRIGIAQEGILEALGGIVEGNLWETVSNKNHKQFATTTSYSSSLGHRNDDAPYPLNDAMEEEEERLEEGEIKETDDKVEAPSPPRPTTTTHSRSKIDVNHNKPNGTSTNGNTSNTITPSPTKKNNKPRRRRKKKKKLNPDDEYEIARGTAAQREIFAFFKQYWSVTIIRNMRKGYDTKYGKNKHDIATSAMLQLTVNKSLSADLTKEDWEVVTCKILADYRAGNVLTENQLSVGWFAGWMVHTKSLSPDGDNRSTSKTNKVPMLTAGQMPPNEAEPMLPSEADSINHADPKPSKNSEDIASTVQEDEVERARAEGPTRNDTSPALVIAFDGVIAAFGEMWTTEVVDGWFSIHNKDMRGETCWDERGQWTMGGIFRPIRPNDQAKTCTPDSGAGVLWLAGVRANEEGTGLVRHPHLYCNPDGKVVRKDETAFLATFRKQHSATVSLFKNQKNQNAKALALMTRDLGLCFHRVDFDSEEVTQHLRSRIDEILKLSFGMYILTVRYGFKVKEKGTKEVKIVYSNVTHTVVWLATLRILFDNQPHKKFYKIEDSDLGTRNQTVQAFNEIFDMDCCIVSDMYVVYDEVDAIHLPKGILMGTNKIYGTALSSAGEKRKGDDKEDALPQKICRTAK